MRDGWLKRYPWLVFVVPFVLYMVVGQFEPTPQAGSPLAYPLVYTLRIVLVVVAIAAVARGYAVFPLRLSWLAIAIGLLGGAIWIGICRLELENRLLAPIGLGGLLGLGSRAALNPFELLGDQPPIMVAFLAVRFAGLVLVVPLIEEMFLRGFVMRFVESVDWHRLPLGEIGAAGIATGTIYGMLTHPAELFAAAVWFSLITGLMLKTRNIWDCVAAHAVTNLTLGVYILYSGRWELW